MSRVLPIMKLVCETHGVTPEDIRSNKRDRPLPWIRQEICWRAYRAGAGPSAIGRVINRDRATVTQSVDAHEALLTFCKRMSGIERMRGRENGAA